MAIEGVMDVVVTKFQRFGVMPDGELEDGRMTARDNEALELLNDPSAPGRGRIRWDFGPDPEGRSTVTSKDVSSRETCSCNRCDCEECGFGVEPQKKRLVNGTLVSKPNGHGGFKRAMQLAGSEHPALMGSHEPG